MTSITPSDANRFAEAYSKGELWLASLLHEETLDIVDSVYVVAFDKERAHEAAFIELLARNGRFEDIPAIMQVEKARF